jgi:hypothetical protein
MKAREWMMQYGVATALAFLLGMVFGQVPLFRETAVGKLHASDLVQFVGYGGALVMVWLGVRQLAKDPPVDWKWLAPFQGLVLPIATLVTVSVFYGVLLLVAGPFLSKSGKGIYNWTFIGAIVISSIWLIVSWVQKCAPLVAGMEPRKLRKVA